MPVPAPPSTLATAIDDTYATLLTCVDALLEVLSAAQRSQLLLPYTFANAARWHTFPQWALGTQRRIGLELRSLSAPQWAALHALLAAATSAHPRQGYAQIQQLFLAEDYLHSISTTGPYGRDEFRLALLGTPSERGRWQLQFGGHHFALANTYSNGRLIGATPAFRGVEPMHPFELQGRSYTLTTSELDAAIALLDTLSAEQRAQASIADGFDDVLLGPGQDWAFPTQPEGIPVAALTDTQRQLLLAILASYVNDLDDANAARILARYARELEQTYVAYAGTLTLTTVGDYLRIDGPSVWIELSIHPPFTTRIPHPHSVWRDKVSDYGGLRP